MEDKSKFFEQIFSELEQSLQPLIIDAKKYYGDDEAGYFVWMCKASQLKRFAPSIPFTELTPEKLNRPISQVSKESSLKR